MTFGGVLIQMRIWGESAMPTTVRKMPAASPKATAVWTASRMLSVFRAPNWREMMTPAPEARPLNRPISMKIRLLEELTAARALLPRKLPTIRESTVLYICWNRFPKKSGRAK